MQWPAPSKCQRQGVILAAVFGFILLMAVFVVQFLGVVSQEMRRHGQRQGIDELRPLAFSVLQATKSVLAEFRELDAGLFGPAQGWCNPMDWAEITWPEEVTVEVRITDENGKLAINELPKEALRTLFDYWEIDFERQNEMLDSLEDWMDDDGPNYELNGAEADWYEDHDWPTVPPNGPLTTLDEIRNIRGWREAFFDEDGRPLPLFDELTATVSVHSSGSLNLNTASNELLHMLADNGVFDAEEVIQFRLGLDLVPCTGDDGFYKSSDELAGLGLPESISLTHEIGVLRIDVILTSGAKHYTLSVLGEFEDDGNFNTLRVRRNLPLE